MLESNMGMTVTETVGVATVQMNCSLAKLIASII